MQHVVSQLIDKRKELAGQFHYYQKLLNELSEQIQAIDTSIAIFDPDIKVKTFKPTRFSPNKRYFKHREAMILIFDVLREAELPMTTADIVKEIMRLKKVDSTVKELYNGVFGTIRARLHMQQKKGVLLYDADGPGKDGYWSINQSHFKPKN